MGHCPSLSVRPPRRRRSSVSDRPTAPSSPLPSSVEKPAYFPEHPHTTSVTWTMSALVCSLGLSLCHDGVLKSIETY